MIMDMMKVSIATGQAINILLNDNKNLVNDVAGINKIENMTKFILKCQTNNYDKFVGKELKEE